MPRGDLHITIHADSYVPSVGQLAGLRELREGIASIDGLSTRSGDLRSRVRPGVPYNAVDWRELVVLWAQPVPPALIAELLAAQVIDWVRRRRGGMTLVA